MFTSPALFATVCIENVQAVMKGERTINFWDQSQLDGGVIIVIMVVRVRTETQAQGELIVARELEIRGNRIIVHIGYGPGDGRLGRRRAG